MEQVRVSHKSVLLRVPTSEGEVFFRAARRPLDINERLLDWELRPHFSEFIPGHIASDPRRGWSLVPFALFAWASQYAPAGIVAITNAMADYQDLYREELRRDGATVRAHGPRGWEPATAHREAVEVAGGEPVEIEVIETARGPVIIGGPDEEPAISLRYPPRVRADGTTGLSVSDFFDYSIYVDARTTAVKQWYIERFMRLRSGAFADPMSYFHRYSTLTDEEAVLTAQDIWDRINGPNLVQNVLPTRGRAKLVMSKDSGHTVTRVLMRKV